VGTSCLFHDINLISIRTLVGFRPHPNYAVCLYSRKCYVTLTHVVTFLDAVLEQAEKRTSTHSYRRFFTEKTGTKEGLLRTCQLNFPHLQISADSRVNIPIFREGALFLLFFKKIDIISIFLAHNGDNSTSFVKQGLYESLATLAATFRLLQNCRLQRGIFSC
jgi:hypothetical protein